MKNGKNYVGFLINKIWQILKRFSGALSWAQTSYFWRVSGLLLRTIKCLSNNSNNIFFSTRQYNNTCMNYELNEVSCFIAAAPLLEEKIRFSKRDTVIKVGRILIASERFVNRKLGQASKDNNDCPWRTLGLFWREIWISPDPFALDRASFVLIS